MNLQEFRALLGTHPDKNLRLLLPDGEAIPASFHVTEVGHVAKSFVDCGGTERSAAACVLQVWVAENDEQHRLTAGKLGAILELARKVVPADSLEVEVEYEGCLISQFPVESAVAGAAELTFTLGRKHTDCLAKEACGLNACGCGPGEGPCC
jgi:hypothetical protein